MLPLVLSLVAAAAATSTTDLSPVVIAPPSSSDSGAARVKPSTSVTLSYGLDSSPDSLVNVSLALNYAAVLLEEVNTVSVSCTDESVAVTFEDEEEFEEAKAEWNVPFVVITNHWGGCDVDYERGVFVATEVEVDEEAMMVSLRAERSDVGSVASQTEIVFSSLPVSSSADKRRDITVNDDGSVLITSSLSLDSTELYSYDPYFTLTADNASLSSSILLSGYVLLDGTDLKNLTFDIDVTSSASLAVTADVTAPWSDTFVYEPEDLSYDLVNIPGILLIGPALTFAIGVELAAQAAVTVTAEQTVAFADGNVHLDFLDSSLTSASGWEPQYTTDLTLSERAAVEVNPYVQVGVELVFEVLAGVIDLSAGLVATPKFNNNVTLDTTQAVDEDGNVEQPVDSDAECSQGALVVSEFEFALDAFVTEWWSETLYEVTVPLAEECYTWA